MNINGATKEYTQGLLQFVLNVLEHMKNMCLIEMNQNARNSFAFKIW